MRSLGEFRLGLGNIIMTTIIEDVGGNEMRGRKKIGLVSGLTAEVVGVACLQ